MSEAYPSDPTRRDAWILARRAGIQRDSLDSQRVSGWVKEIEPDADGKLQPGLTLFLTNRECPWRCLMCDLWRHTLTTRVERGDIPAQLDAALQGAGATPLVEHWLKLYNAGSFFDPGAIPTADLETIARRIRPYQRVIVENHPALTDQRVLPFRDALGDSRLELALGLETAHPRILELLNKRVTLDDFRRAADFLATQDLDLRVFVLVKPPFLSESEALEWACRSLDFAFECGAKVVSIIPTRYGNGALEELAKRGEFLPPMAETVHAAFQYGLALRRGRVFVDLWDLDRSVSNPERLPEYRGHWQEMNWKQK